LQCARAIFSLWHVQLYSIFSTLFQNGMIFGKKLLNMKCVFRFYLLILANTWSNCISRTVQVRIAHVQWSLVLRVSLDDSNI